MAVVAAGPVGCGEPAPAPDDPPLADELPRPDPDLPPLPEDAGVIDEDPDAGVPTAPDAGEPADAGEGPGPGGADGGVADGGAGIPDGPLGPGSRARVTAPDFLNLRSGPAQSASILVEMPCGAEVTIVSGPSGRWWEVTYGTRQGWASGVYLVTASEFDPSVCPAAPPPPGPSTGVAPPASLVRAMSSKPYVEGSCTQTTFAGWPYEAQRCTYGNGLQVTVANPTPERVARWIVDAAQMIPALDGLRTRDPANWEAGLKVIADNMMGQSSRIFPLSGIVREGTINYRFDRGVTAGCTSGCYCRINSTTRREWCRYRAQVLQAGNEQRCLDEFGQTTNRFAEAWGDHCLQNHVASWAADSNPHFRARAYGAQLSFGSQFPNPATASGPAVVRALKGCFVVY
jgi:uncharacterized protein YraI